MTTPGFYSLIQYRRDAVRAEGVNVGVVLGGEGQRIHVKLASQNEQVKKRFGKSSFDDTRLDFEKRGLGRRLEESNPTSAEQLLRFAALEAGRLVLLEPRPMMISELVRDAERLFEKLVADPDPVHRRRGRAPRLDGYFEPLVASRLVQKAVTVTIPITGKPLRSDYAYRNGRRNLIKAHEFSPEVDSAYSNASEIGSKGLLLANHPQGHVESRLILVADIEDLCMRKSIGDMLMDHQVRLVDVRELGEFVEEVRREAHD
jgi:hypothetical protein